MKKLSLKLAAGFTLVEVLVSITLLLMVVVGPMQILSRANNSTAFATEQQTAWLLAQEGLELAQYGRDNFLLQYFNGNTTNPWARFRSGTGIYASCFTAAGCGLVIGNTGVTTVTPCSPISNCQLYLNTSATARASYQHTGAVDTIVPYTRVIRMRETRAGAEVAASSTVSWRTGSLIAGQSVVTSTYFFNIYDTD